LNDWNLNDSFDFLNSFFNDDFGNDSFDDLWDFDNLFDHSWYYNDSFDNLFDFDNLGYFHHFLDDFLNWNSNFLDSIHVSEDLHDLLLNIFDWLGDFNVMVDNLFDFDGPWLSDNNWISDFHYDWNLSFDDLNHWFFDNFCDFHNSLVNDWHLHDSIDFLVDLFDNCDDSIDNLFYFFNFLLDHNFLMHNDDLIRLSDGIGNCYDFLHDLWDFNNSFFNLNDGDRLINYSIDDNVSNLNVVLDLFGISVLNLGHDYLFDSLDFHYLWDLDNLLYNFLDNHWHLDDSINNFLGCHYFLFGSFNFFNFIRDMINDLFD
jgi:hypothetical protein